MTREPWCASQVLEELVEAARRADREYELARTDAGDGEFALWSMDRLVSALHALRPALAAVDKTSAGDTEISSSSLEDEDRPADEAILAWYRGQGRTENGTESPQ